jgi:hypothetical protein
VHPTRHFSLIIATVFALQIAVADSPNSSRDNKPHKFPVPKSKVIAGIEWLGERTLYPLVTIRGDTFPMTWAADGEIYTSAGDPGWGSSKDGLDVEKFTGGPENYHIDKVNEMPDYTGPGGTGPKPTGMISVNGVLYLGVQNLLGKKAPAHGTASQHGSDASILRSDDYGKTWTPGRNTAPMFPGHLFGGPAFINFGKDNSGAKDHYVYAVTSDQWDNGSDLRLGRVPNDKIQDAASWEWVGSFENGKPVWTKNLTSATPILSDDRYISIPEMVYLSKIKRYLLLTWREKKDFDPAYGSELIIYDSPEPWGPFSVVDYEPSWESIAFNPYCPRIPLKWMEDDGITGWMQCSGNWGFNSPDGWQSTVYYRSSVRKFRLNLVQQDNFPRDHK